MLTPLITTTQAEDHAVHLAFLAFVAVLALVLTGAVVVDVVRNHRSSR